MPSANGPPMPAPRNILYPQSTSEIGGSDMSLLRGWPCAQPPIWQMVPNIVQLKTSRAGTIISERKINLFISAGITRAEHEHTIKLGSFASTTAAKLTPGAQRCLGAEGQLRRGCDKTS